MHNFMVNQGTECAQFGVVCDCNFSIESAYAYFTKPNQKLDRYILLEPRQCCANHG